MSNDKERTRLAVAEFAQQCSSAMIPVNNRFSFFSAVPIAEEDLKQYVHEPLQAIPAAIVASLPNLALLLVPFLEKGNGKTPDLVVFEKPPENRQIFSSRLTADEQTYLALAIQDEHTADYHYTLYFEIAGILTERWPETDQEKYFRLLREELRGEVHGEVEDRSWHLKQALLRRQKNVRQETKLFREYAQQSFQETLTLYLHGICCDIDVETGPRQMPSRYLRKRLQLLHSLYPPPDGYAVFPEELKKR